MSILGKRWEVQPALSKAALRAYAGMDPVLAQLLHNRGLTDPQAAAHFLYDNELRTYHPYHLADMDKAVLRIRHAVQRKESIAIYGDFDADGVTSTALMVTFLKALGAQVQAYIPNRIDEGYGLNSPALDELKRRGVQLVITVDCGIRSVQEVADGVRYGLDIIVTDHHSLNMDGAIPEAALAVINPQREDTQEAAFKGLSGVGVAFTLARALLADAYQRKGKTEALKVKYESLLDSLLDLVAIGTVADIMPLNNPLNRILVKRGLHRINIEPRLGILKLLEAASVKPGKITAMDIGFVIGPRLNAAGRLSDAMLAAELLITQDTAQAEQLAQELNTLNTKRQELTRNSQERISTALKAQSAAPAHIIIAQDDDILPGIVGLVAGRLTEEYYRPTVVLEHGEHESRASCRSIPEFHITHALDECADLLSRHGGHAMAAGFTVPNDNLALLRERLIAKAEAVLGELSLEPRLLVDLELPASALSMDSTFPLAKDLLTVLEPTGHKNPQGVFVTYGMPLLDARLVGNDRRHLKLALKGGGTSPIEAIGFGLAERLPALEQRGVVDVVYQLDINVYNGRESLQLRVLDCRPSQEE